MIRLCLFSFPDLLNLDLLNFEFFECLLLNGIFIQVIYTKVKKSDVEEFFDSIKKGTPPQSEKENNKQ